MADTSESGKRGSSAVVEADEAYDKFVEDNLLQDFVGKDLWAITDFREYVKVPFRNR